MTTKYCECGRKIVIHAHPGRNPKAMKHHRYMKDHELCGHCWGQLMGKVMAAQRNRDDRGLA